jgi:hypothetical protein
MSHGRGVPLTTPRFALLGAATFLIAACSNPPSKPVTPESAAPVGTAGGPSANAKAAEPSRIGTVGLIRELKDRGMTSENWTGVIGSVFTNDTEKDVIRVRYEVTVFFKDGTQGVVIVNQRPTAQTGQRVRITGDQIESLER